MSCPARTMATALMLVAGLACGGSGPPGGQSAANAPASKAAPSVPVAAQPASTPDDQDDQMLAAPPPTRASCGDSAHCYQQALAAERTEPARAAEQFEAACEQGLAQACLRLSRIYEAGRGVGRDDRRAQELREHACALGSTAACDELGH